MIRAFSVLSVLTLLLLLGGCATMRDLPDTRQPVCDALIGPLHYNSVQRTSRRFAGPDLAADIAQRNRVGQNLKCSKYR